MTHVILERRNTIAVIWLNRPEKLNALTLKMREGILEHLVTCDRDPTIRAVILAGRGDRAFCAGADLSEVRMRTSDSELSYDAGLRRQVPRLLETMSKPSIAALHGYVLGAGLELAMACTFRIAEPKAIFGLPEVQHGILPGSGGTQRLARLVGPQWALEFVLTGRKVTADEAWRIGLVTRMVDRESLMDQALSLAEGLAGLSAVAVSLGKKAVLAAMERGLDQDIEFERVLFALALQQQTGGGRTI